MSRSRKKTKIHGICIGSDKDDKRHANRKLRRVTRYKIRIGASVLPRLREVSNIWAFVKDGKMYNSEMSEKDMRK